MMHRERTIPKPREENGRSQDDRKKRTEKRLQTITISLTPDMAKQSEKTMRAEHRMRLRLIREALRMGEGNWWRMPERGISVESARLVEVGQYGGKEQAWDLL
jgi:hypothetical protein